MTVSDLLRIAHACDADMLYQAVEVAALRRQNQLSGDFYQVAQALILCGLPYQPSTLNKITRSARLADGTRLQVTFSASLDTGLPYGSDLSVFHFLLDKAVKTQSPFVTWKTASQFLKAMGMQQGGKNRRDLRERFLRIRGLTIGVQRSSSGTSETQIMPVIKRSRLPTSISPCAGNDWFGKEALKHPVDDLGLEIDASFFAELVAHPVVVPVELIRATRGKPQLQDMILFPYRCCYAVGPYPRFHGVNSASNSGKPIPTFHALDLGSRSLYERCKHFGQRCPRPLIRYRQTCCAHPYSEVANYRLNECTSLLSPLDSKLATV